MQYYITEASENNWSVRTLDRNISTLYYQRLLSSQNKDIVIAEMKGKTVDFQDKLEFIKNPTVLEFLGLPNNSGYIEAELEKAIIDHIQITLYFVRSYDRTITRPSASCFVPRLIKPLRDILFLMKTNSYLPASLLLLLFAVV